MLDNPTSSITFLVSFLPIIQIEEITFIDSKKSINIFSTSYIVILIALGLINGDLKSEFYIIESIVLILFFSKYYYSLIYNNYQKRIQLKQLNDELTVAYQEVARLTTKKIKQEVARDLHDSLVQDLIGIRLQLATIEMQVQKKNFSVANKNLKNTQILTRDAIFASRKKITEYRQMKNEDKEATFKDKLNEKAQLLKTRYGLLTNLEIEDNLELPSRVLDDVVQIINEALVNVVRHAETNQAKVVASVTQEKLIIKIVNNGIPFLKKQQHGHYGLIGMRERAKLHGGTLKILSTPEISTIVLIEIPLGGESNV
ncbi:histidine kinase [Lactiplantibacillus paraplantarum]|uniref:sensor histidine kinase n=1 Tax=Lactiplantibacillus paraplantarum TaxID=60520 RepID=UPI0021A4CD73|nr:histidine kinase [Lactiplantibacillus paraplantarum]